MRCKFFLFIILFQINLFAQTSGDLTIPSFHEVPVRETKYPLKDKKMIFPDSLVDIARENITRYTSAKGIRDKIINRADYWLGFDHEALLKIITSAEVPRAFDLSTSGCPLHGDTIFSVGGTYPWIIDPKKPLQVKCPVGGEVYPTNNRADCHHNGFACEQAGDSLFVDDGWGWKDPSGERFWFVAYANQWIWNRHVGPGLTALGQAYILTGDVRYASKATEMLYLIAEVYPSMDYENQSRYGLMMKQQNIRYPGKVLNRIWETRLITGFAEAYDMVWDQIDHCLEFQKKIGKGGREIRSFIEANLLEDAIDAIKQEKILGNFGMHQDALVTLHLARQHAGRDEAIEALVNRHSSRFATSGVRYALYNQVKRDGIPYESPGYNTIWVTQMTKIADKLSKMEIDLFGEKRLKRLIDTPLEMVAIGLYTPDVGDGGSVLGGLIGRNADIYHIAYNHYGEDKYLHWINRAEEKSFSSFASLFRKPLLSIGKLPANRVVKPMPSRLFAGYGLGILNNRTDQTALSLTYGKHYSHFHWDFLNFEIFANGQKMMPDLGYPDAMNAFVPGIYSWSTNTISHNTVVVDAKRQQRNLPGTLHEFADGPFARAIDASSSAYVNAQTYRRNIIMVDTDNEQSYFVDFFRVSGGNRHDYSLHGPPGEVLQLEGQWSDTLQGTFAGPNVPVGRMYDNERLQKEGPQTGYGGYVGSGFQHLFNQQQLENGIGMLEYRHIRDKDARLRILLLPDAPQQVFMADAYDKPRGKNHLVKYLIASRESVDDTPLESTFVSLLAPYRGESCQYQTARLIHPDQGSGHLVVVERDSVTDVVIFDAEASKKVLNRFDISTDAVRAVATFKEDKLTRLFFSEGTYFRTKEKEFKAEEISGRVVSVDAMNSSFTVEAEGIKMNDGEKLSHRIAHFTNPYRTTVHPLEMIQLTSGIMKITTKDDLLTGRLAISDIEDKQLKTTTSMTFAGDYIGATLLDNAFQPIGTLKSMQRGVMTLEKSTAFETVKAGDVTWMCNIGSGDEFVIKPLFSWSED